MPVVYENIAESDEAYRRNYIMDGKHSPMIKTDQQRI